MNYKDITILTQNSDLTSKYIAYFLSGQVNGEIRLEFVYLLLPLLYNRNTREKLAATNSNSTLDSTLRFNAAKFCSGINLRHTYFRQRTNLGMIVATRKHSIQISDYLKINDGSRLNYKSEKDKELKQFCKAAFNLGRLLKKDESPELFAKLGIFIV